MRPDEEKTEKKSLASAITALEDTVNKIGILVFGEKPVAETKEAIAGDKITRTRDRIIEATEILEVISSRLEILG